MNLSTVKWAQWDKTQSRELLVCSYACALHSAQFLHTILHRTNLIVFPHTLQTITTAPMMSIWGRGRGGWQGRLHCDVCGKMFPRPECMCRHRHAEHEHNILADSASSNYSYYCHHPAAPHHTQFTLYPSMNGRQVRDTSPWMAACGAHYEHVVSSRLTTMLPPSLCRSGSSQVESWFAGQYSRSNRNRQCSIAACPLLCWSSVINRFSQFDHRIWR